MELSSSARVRKGEQIERTRGLGACRARWAPERRGADWFRSSQTRAVVSQSSPFLAKADKTKSFGSDCGVLNSKKGRLVPGMRAERQQALLLLLCSVLSLSSAEEARARPPAALSHKFLITLLLFGVQGLLFSIEGLGIMVRVSGFGPREKTVRGCGRGLSPTSFKSRRGKLSLRTRQRAQL